MVACPLDAVSGQDITGEVDSDVVVERRSGGASCMADQRQTSRVLASSRRPARRGVAGG